MFKRKKANIPDEIKEQLDCFHGLKKKYEQERSEFVAYATSHNAKYDKACTKGNLIMFCGYILIFASIIYFIILMVKGKGALMQIVSFVGLVIGRTMADLGRKYVLDDDEMEELTKEYFEYKNVQPEDMELACMIFSHREDELKKHSLINRLMEQGLLRVSDLKGFDLDGDYDDFDCDSDD
mgnify:CR=1 FL=1